MNTLKLYRKRLIPEECIPLKDDTLVKQTDDIIVTSWNCLRPKTTFQYGASCYFLKEGIKVSKFYRADGSLYCWYCDVVEYDFPEPDTLIITDLLADVVLFPDGRLRVLDLDELAQALDKGLISTDTLKLALVRLNTLLTAIYEGRFPEFQNELDSLSL